MIRLSLIFQVVGFAALSLCTPTLMAVDVLVSGEQTVLVIDIDGDGPDETEDCRFTATFNNSRYRFSPAGDTETLRGCTGDLFMDLRNQGQDSSSDWVEFDTSTSGTAASGGSPGFPAMTGFLTFPFEIELIDESGSPDGRPLDLNWIRFEDPPGTDTVKTEAFICDNDGPVLALEVIRDMLVVHIPFKPYPSAESTEYLSLQNIPFEMAPPNAGTIANHDVYLPVTEDGHVTVANADNPNNKFIDIDFATLTDCDSLINLQPPESSFYIVPAISDAWYNPLTNGQGFFIIVWEQQKLVFLSWFTYDTERPPENATAIFGEPGHRWVTALGSYDKDTALLDVFLSGGMLFDSGDPPVTTEQLQGAVIEIVWSGCNAGVVRYNIPSVNKSGEIPIERIVLDNVQECEDEQPEGGTTEKH